MPFTPLHLGPGLAVKSVSQQKFSLLVFAWAQVLIDLEPLMVILTGKGTLHGISHTFAAGTALGALAALSGKPVLDWLHKVLRKKNRPPAVLSWRTALWSGIGGGVSHILLDALIYPDMSPFWPLLQGNPMDVFTNTGMTRFCILSGLAGALVWLVVALVNRLDKKPARTE